jgi:hypothetical protein
MRVVNLLTRDICPRGDTKRLPRTSVCAFGRDVVRCRVRDSIQTERCPADRDWLSPWETRWLVAESCGAPQRQSSFAARFIPERQSIPDDAAISFLKRG